MSLQLGLFPEDPPAPTTGSVGPAAVPADLRAVAKRLPRNLRLGTSSWSFPGWEGIVYDRPASQRSLAQEGLSAYGRHPLFRTVGIDRTFYRPIGAEDFQRYADDVPRDFRFLTKADRALTFPELPGRPGVRVPNPSFLDARHAAVEVVGPMVEGLGKKAGPLLFQFPPIAPSVVGGRGAFVSRLRDFLAALPEGPLYAVELRTPAFLTEEYAEMLLDVGVAHCFTVHPAMAPLQKQMEVVHAYRQPALVVRWMLHSGFRYEVAKERYAPFDELVDEDEDARERIARAVLDAAVAERDAWVIANNKAEGSAPLTLGKLAARIADWRPLPESPTETRPDAS